MLLRWLRSFLARLFCRDSSDTGHPIGELRPSNPEPELWTLKRSCAAVYFFDALAPAHGLEISYKGQPDATSKHCFNITLTPPPSSSVSLNGDESTATSRRNAEHRHRCFHQQQQYISYRQIWSLSTSAIRSLLEHPYPSQLRKLQTSHVGI